MSDTELDTTIQSSEAKRRPARNVAITVSILVHGLIAIVLLFIYLPNSETDEVAQEPSRSQSSSSREEFSGDPKPELQPAAIEDVPAEELERSIEAEIERADRLSDEEQLTELEKNLRRLESISDTESVSEVSETIANTLGLDTEAYSPDKQAAEGSFDFDSAQLDDVTRSQGEDGQWEYQSVLVDSDGRKMTVPMAPGEGETMYATFEQMKKYPLAQSIYRSVVMPMLQSLIESEKAAADARQE